MPESEVPRGKGSALLDRWLASSHRPSDTYPSFDVVDMLEAAAPSAEVENHLCELIAQSAVDLDFLADVTRRLGWQRAEQAVGQRLPQNSRAQRGRFGEVLGVAVLEQLDGYVLPIQKAHFAITGGQSQPSTDAVLVKLDSGAIVEVCFVESKLRSVRDRFAAVQGVRQLEADYAKEEHDMLLFTAARLYDMESALYDPLLEYMASRSEENIDSFRLMLCYDATVWTDDALNDLRDDEPTASPLTVHVARVAELRTLVETIFNRVGIAVDDDEP
jgi:Cap4 SAVED domain